MLELSLIRTTVATPPNPPVPGVFKEFSVNFETRIHGRNGLPDRAFEDDRSSLAVYLNVTPVCG
jgi:hypothetical protein